MEPCGTPAAARRHRRKDEPLDEPCRLAEAKQKADQRAARQKAIRENVAIILNTEPEVEEDIDELTELRENLRIVRAAMKGSPPQAIAALSKQRQELVSKIKKLESEKKPEEGGNSVASIRARREARQSAS